jgi:hypothetical protein
MHLITQYVRKVTLIVYIGVNSGVLIYLNVLQIVT